MGAVVKLDLRRGRLCWLHHFMVTWGGRELPFSSDVSVVVVVYKVTIEVNEPQESLQFFNSAWS